MSGLLKITSRGLILIPLLKEEGEVDESFRSGCGYIDVSFHRFSTVQVRDIQFQNHYTYRLMVLHQTSDPSRIPAGGDHGWKLGVPWKVLMASPHCEKGAEETFSLAEDLGESGLNEVTRLRIYLQQPSGVWKQFNLHNIQIFGKTKGTREAPLNSLRMAGDSGSKDNINNHNNVYHGELSKDLRKVLTDSMIVHKYTRDIENFDTISSTH